MKLLTYSNGLRIIYEKPKSDLPITSIYSFCNLGPAHEPDDMRGISHFIEHMCFKGTKNKPHPKSIFLLCDKIGAYFNAFTNKRYTCYTIECEDKHFSDCLFHLSDMMLNSIFDKKEFAKELNVVAQENKDDLNDPMEVAEIETHKKLFEGSSYECPIDHVDYHKKKFDYNKCIELYKLFYTPNNMVLSISSNLPFEKINSFVKKSYFYKNTQKHNLSDIIQINHYLKPKNEISYNLIKKSGASNNTIIIGFRTCGFNNPDKYTLILLKNAIGDNMSGRLKYILREEKGLVYSCSIDTQFFEKFGCLLFVAQTEFKNVIISNTHGVLPTIIQIIRSLIENGIKQTEIDIAKGNIQGEILLELQNCSNQALHNGESLLLNENNNIVSIKNIYDKYYKKINKKQIDQTIKKYFMSKNMSVCIVGEKNPSLIKVSNICKRI